jgi:hypothetical protein
VLKHKAEQLEKQLQEGKQEADIRTQEVGSELMSLSI